MKVGNITVTKEQLFEMTLVCYRSGQIDEARWQLHLSDPEFRKWVESREG